MRPAGGGTARPPVGRLRLRRVALGGQDTLDPGVMAEVLATLTEGCLVLVAADDPQRARPAQGGDLALTNPP